MANNIEMAQPASSGAVVCDDLELDQVQGGGAFDAFLFIDGVKGESSDGATSRPGVRLGSIAPRTTTGG